MNEQLNQTSYERLCKAHFYEALTLHFRCKGAIAHPALGSLSFSSTPGERRLASSYT